MALKKWVQELPRPNKKGVWVSAHEQRLNSKAKGSLNKPYVGPKKANGWTKPDPKGKRPAGGR